MRKLILKNCTPASKRGFCGCGNSGHLVPPVYSNHLLQTWISVIFPCVQRQLLGAEPARSCYEGQFHKYAALAEEKCGEGGGRVGTILAVIVEGKF